MEILTDLKEIGDLSMRFKTDIKSGGSLFTDLNGHTIQQHKYKEKLKLQVFSRRFITRGALYPISPTSEMNMILSKLIKFSPCSPYLLTRNITRVTSSRCPLRHLSKIQRLGSQYSVLNLTVWLR